MNKASNRRIDSLRLEEEEDLKHCVDRDVDPEIIDCNLTERQRLVFVRSGTGPVSRRLASLIFIRPKNANVSRLDQRNRSLSDTFITQNVSQNRHVSRYTCSAD